MPSTSWLVRRIGSHSAHLGLLSWRSETSSQLVTPGGARAAAGEDVNKVPARA